MLTARTAEKAGQARSRVVEVAPGALVETAALDLSSLVSIRRFASDKLARAAPIDVLINNAGVKALRERTLGLDGFELQFATNVLGPFALTGLLLPLILASRTHRIATVSSSIPGSSDVLQLDNLNSERWYHPLRTCAQTKLMNALFGRELQRRGRDKLLSLAVHPGCAKTNLLIREPTVLMRILTALFLPLSQSAAQGAWPILYAATGAYARRLLRSTHQLGGIRGNVKQVVMSQPAYDDEVAARLFDRLELLSGVSFKL